MYSDNLSFSEYSSLSQLHGSSFFVLDPFRLRANINNLRNSFLSNYYSVEIGYSYKTNYAPHVCRILHEEGAWAEVVSEMEYAAACRLGVPRNHIIFNGPYKAEWAFEDAALHGSLINLDNERDLDLLVKVARKAPSDYCIRVALRLNFPLEEKVSRFGFDVDSSDFSAVLSFINNLKNVKLSGLHCHFPNRDLDSFRRRVDRLISLCKTIFPEYPPDILNIGGGFFSSLSDSLLSLLDEPPPSFDDYASVIGKRLTNAFPDSATAPTLFLEPGTALVADVLKFYTEVLSTKTVRGRNFANVSGSIFDISPNAKSKALPVTPILKPSSTRGPAHDFAIAGFTCIEGDILTESLFCQLEAGDVLVYGNVGSYSLVMRPPFILPSNPVLMGREDQYAFDVIKARQSNSDIFDLYKYSGLMSSDQLK